MRLRSTALCASVATGVPPRQHKHLHRHQADQYPGAARGIGHGTNFHFVESHVDSSASGAGIDVADGHRRRSGGGGSTRRGAASYPGRRLRNAGAAGRTAGSPRPLDRSDRGLPGTGRCWMRFLSADTRQRIAMARGTGPEVGEPKALKVASPSAFIASAPKAPRLTAKQE